MNSEHTKKMNSQNDSPPSRRDFLKTTSSAAVGTAILGGLSVARSAHGASADDTLKIALIGCGGRGSGAANQALSTEGKTKLVAMADAFPDQLEGSLKNLKRQHGDKVAVTDDKKFIGFDAYKQAIAEADVVILATPPGFRPIHFEEAVKQGKNIFTEKPVATDGPGVRRFLAAAEESKKKNLKVGVGLQRHQQAGDLETLKHMEDGAIGDITAMRVYWNGTTPWVHPRAELERKYGRALPELEYQMRNWYYFVWICGDHIVEQHIHNLDVANWFLKGHPVRAWGMGGVETRKGPDSGEIFDHHYVEFEYANGARVFSQCRHQNGTWSSVSEHAIGTKGVCDVSGHIIRPFSGSAVRINSRGKDPYQQEHDDFFAAIRNNKPYNEAEYGAHSTMTAIMGRMATYAGKEITWDNAINSQISVMPKQYSFDATPPTGPGPDG